jgi:predicted RNase H-like HicB family nuclease
LRRYTLLLIPDPDAGGYTVEVPALPGCITEGDTLEEAVANAREAIAVWIKSAEKHGEEIPEEKAPLGLVNIVVAA